MQNQRRLAEKAKANYWRARQEPRTLSRHERREIQNRLYGVKPPLPPPSEPADLGDEELSVEPPAVEPPEPEPAVEPEPEVEVPTDPVVALEELRLTIVANMGKVISLFLEWDTDGSGSVERHEFIAAMRSVPEIGGRYFSRQPRHVDDSAHTE